MDYLRLITGAVGRGRRAVPVSQVSSAAEVRIVPQKPVIRQFANFNGWGALSIYSEVPRWCTLDVQQEFFAPAA